MIFMAGKHRISITLDEDVVKRIDRIVTGADIKNRSHAIERLLIKYLDEQKMTHAVILCGGVGAKLRPITYEIPKPMILIHDRPVLEYIIEHLKDEGITDILLAVGYKQEKIISYFGNGSRFGVNIHYITEEKPLGTAGCLSAVSDIVDNTFLLLYGDILSKVDIADMLRAHRKNKVLATMALTTAPDVSTYGVAKLKGNKVVGFIEKPSHEMAPSRLINAGVFIMEPEILENVSGGGKVMLESIFEKIAPQDQLGGYVYDGKWFDLETPERYEDAIKMWDAKD